MKRAHKTLLNRCIFILLVVAFITTIPGISAASSSADQSQSCQLSVTRDGVAYNLDQVQIAVVENGILKQYQLSDINVIYDEQGKVKKVTVKLREIQTVKSSSTTESVNIINSYEYQNANVVTTKDSAKINLNQVQLALEDSNGVIKQKQVAVIKVKFTKHGVKVIIKMRQVQKIR
ncbi:MAG: hypothetical protein ACPK85_15835 [Methanosarcina sp.]